MTVTCHLYSEWTAGIRQELTRAGFDHSKLSDQDCAIRWQSWKRRSVRTQVRTVERAAGFSCPAHVQNGLIDLESAIVRGADLAPWQSKLVDRPGYEDGLYNDYRITHFHLGAGTDASGYIKRTKELLFAVVDSTSVYEISVYDHGQWYELDILDIIDAHWPHLLDEVTIHGMGATNSPTTREEVKALRDAHVISHLLLKSGRLIAPLGGGTMINGTSFEAVLAANQWSRILKLGERHIADAIDEGINKGVLAARDYDVHLHSTDDEIAGVVAGVCKWTLWKR